MNLYELAREHARKAVTSREKIYQGQDEARVDWAMSSREGESEDFVVKWMTSQTAKALIADNQWQMKQAGMFALLTIADASIKIASELMQANKYLARIVHNTTRTSGE